LVNLPPGTLMSAGLIFLAVVLATIAVVLVWEAMRDRARKAVVTKQLEKLNADDLTSDAGARTLFRGTAAALPRWLEPLAAKVPQLRDLDILMEQAAVRWTSQTLLILMSGFAAA